MSEAALTKAKILSLSRSVDSSVSAQDQQNNSNAFGLTKDGVCFYLVEGVPDLGAAIRWAATQQAEQLNVFVESREDSDLAQTLARRSRLLELPFEVDVYAFTLTVGTKQAFDIIKAVPSEPGSVKDIAEHHLGYEPLMIAAGADPFNCFGMLVAEVKGLEVARVVETEAGVELNVGVGEADRELQSYVHSHLDESARLERAVKMVKEYRKKGTEHPLGRVARQRWLLSEVVDKPEISGVSGLVQVSPMRERESLLDQSAAAGFSEAENRVVVCSVGADLDLICEAADYRELLSPCSGLVIVVPAKDEALSANKASEWIENVEVIALADSDLPWTK